MTRRKLSRRELLGNVLRLIVAGGGTAGVVALTQKRGEKCTNLGICRSCQAVTGCGLPQAMSFRESDDGQRTLNGKETRA